jgi:transcriptional regulator with XRE-family HTH domain
MYRLRISGLERRKMMLDANPVALTAGWGSSMPLRAPGWNERPLGDDYSNLLGPTWIATDFDAYSTSPARAYGEQAIFFVVDSKPLAVVLRPSIEVKPAVSMASLTISDRLNFVKETLGLSITQLAELFGVTRKTVYDWYEGAEPRQAMIGRLIALQEVFDASGDANLLRLKAFWSVPVNGRSFLSTLQSDTLAGPDLKAELLATLNGLSEEIDAPVRTSARKAGPLSESAISDIERRTDSYL